MPKLNGYKVQHEQNRKLRVKLIHEPQPKKKTPKVEDADD